MVGRSRNERCSKCGIQMLVPPLAWRAQCTVCHAVTSFRPSLGQHHHNPIGHVMGLFRGLASDHNKSSSSSSPPSDRLNPSVQSGQNSNLNWPASYPPGYGKKRAVLCGVTYIGRKYELKGTITDVTYMKHMLINQFQFPEDCILVLTEEQEDRFLIPTRANLLKAMQWLVQNCKSGDSLVFHFSGHGSQKVSMEHDEKDGFDETICPLDYETSGMIVDDDINDIIVRPIPAGAKLHAIIDACHSGTVLDLPFVCRLNRAGICEWVDHRLPLQKPKGTNGGLAICISGCADHQTSADTAALSRDTTTGAMTYSFIYVLENEPGVTYGNLLFKMRSVIRGTTTIPKLKGPLATIARKVFNYKLTQEPQLSSSQEFDVYRRPLLL